MKKLSKLKLNVLNHSNLSNKEMNSLVGGGDGECVCSCSCYWEGQGGSSANTNGNANAQLKIDSQHGCNQYCWDGNQSGGNLGGGWSNNGSLSA